MPFTLKVAILTFLALGSDWGLLVFLLGFLVGIVSLAADLSALARSLH